MFALTKLLELQHVGILTRCLKLNFQPTDPLDSFSCCKQATVPQVLYGSFRCLLKGENQNQISQVSLLVAFTRMNDPSCLMRLSSLWCPDCQNFEMFRVFDEGLPIKQQTDPETTSLSVGKYPIVPRHNLIVISAVKLDGFQTWPRSLPRDWIIVADFLGFKSRHARQPVSGRCTAQRPSSLPWFLTSSGRLEGCATRLGEFLPTSSGETLHKFNLLKPWSTYCNSIAFRKYMWQVPFWRANTLRFLICA